MLGKEDFQMLFDLAADAMFILDEDSVILETNQVAYRQLGYAKAEMIGKSIGDFILPEFSAKLKKRFSKVRDQGYLIYESAMVRKDGSVLPVEISNRVMDLNGKKAFYGVVRDISERKRLDDALKESEARFRTLSEDAPEAIVIHDLDTGLFVDATTSAERLFACGRDEILQHGPEYFYAPNQPYGALSLASIRERGQRILAGEQMTFERLVRNRKGQDILCEVRLVRLPSSSRKLIRASYIDITERKQIEDALRDSTDRLNEAQRISHVGSWSLDLLSGKLIWSDEVFRLIEIDPQQFGASYEAFLNAIHPDDRDAVDHAYTVSLKNRTPYEITHRLLMADGRFKWVHERCDSEFDAAGKPLKSVGTIQDITEQKRIEDELHQAKQQMDSIVSNIPTMVFLKRASDLRFELFNRAGEELLGYSAEEILGKNDYELFPREQADFSTSQDRRALASKNVIEIPEEKITTASGEVRYLYTKKAALRDLAGEPLHLLGISLDITERKQAEAELRLVAAAFESQEGLMIADANSIILRVNRAFTEITGYTAEEAVGMTPRILQSGRHNADFYQAMWESIKATGGWQGEIWDRHKSGKEYPKWLTITAVKDDAGVVTHYIGAQYDITERKQAEDKINELAFFDQLTGLPNRTLLLDRLRQTMTANSRSGSIGALLFIDLDKFKTLNDTLGHDMGDLLLKQVARRLTTCIRAGDTVARHGGDEFVVMLANLSSSEREAATQTESVGEKILAALNQPYQLGDIVYNSTPSIGATLFTGNQVAVGDLMKQADLAMYKSKEAGRNALHFFDPDMEIVVMKRAVLEKDLRVAIDEKQFQLHYQAQMAGSRLTGAEVLVRWEHPQRGLLSPLEFISLAEETGLILPLGYWVLETACTQLSVWEGKPEFSHLTLAVNISIHQFRQPDFVEQVLAILGNTGANPARLILELTERLMADNVEEMIDKMAALKVRGVGFSLDDFGTGFTSLSHLKRLPLDQLKIDQSFVCDVLCDPGAAAIVRTVIGVAQTLGLSVIAEGVITAEQRDFLAGAGCQAYQGYLVNHPLPAGSFEEFARTI